MEHASIYFPALQRSLSGSALGYRFQFSIFYLFRVTVFSLRITAPPVDQNNRRILQTRLVQLPLYFFFSQKGVPLSRSSSLFFFFFSFVLPSTSFERKNISIFFFVSIFFEKFFRMIKFPFFFFLRTTSENTWNVSSSPFRRREKEEEKFGKTITSINVKRIFTRIYSELAELLITDDTWNGHHDSISTITKSNRAWK